jgi:hypothetical protein
MKTMKDLLSQEFEMKNLGEMEYCLGIEVRRDHILKTIRLGKSKYICETLLRFGMHDYKLVSTPLDVNVKFFALANDMTQEEYKIMYEIPFR